MSMGAAMILRDYGLTIFHVWYTIIFIYPIQISQTHVGKYTSVLSRWCRQLWQLPHCRVKNIQLDSPLDWHVRLPAIFLKEPAGKDGHKYQQPCAIPRTGSMMWLLNVLTSEPKPCGFLFSRGDALLFPNSEPTASGSQEGRPLAPSKVK